VVKYVEAIVDDRLHGDVLLGWNDGFERSWRALAVASDAGRIARIDRGWSTVWFDTVGAEVRVRNIGADVAVGDWVIVSSDDERVDHVLDRRSAFVRRASFEGRRAESHTIAANIDVVMLVHSLASPPNQRRLERELVLAFDSGAQPVVVLTKRDLCDEPQRTLDTLTDVAPDVAVHLASGITGEGIERLAEYAAGNQTIALLGASGVGKSTLINALIGSEALRTSEVRAGDQRGKHTTTAAELVPIPGEGWLIDTPGVRAVSLWSSGQGIERAFIDVFDLMDNCRFRDCKHEDEPGCAVGAAIADGRLDPRRLEAMKRLVAEEQALEEEQRVQLKAQDKRGARRARPRA